MVKNLPAVWERKKLKSLSRVRLFATPWTVAYQAPPSMGFSRQEYWSGVPLPSPSVGLALSYSVKPPQPGSLVGPVMKSTAIILIRDRGQG